MLSYPLFIISHLIILKIFTLIYKHMGILIVGMRKKYVLYSNIIEWRVILQRMDSQLVKSNKINVFCTLYEKVCGTNLCKNHCLFFHNKETFHAVGSFWFTITLDNAFFVVADWWWCVYCFAAHLELEDHSLSG